MTPAVPQATDDVPAGTPGWSQRQQDEVLLALVEEVQDYAILMLDTEGRVATWNAGARRFKGYEADEIIGRHFSVFYPPQDVAAGKPQHELEVAADEGRLEDEGWRVRKDGTRFWANVVITALRDENGFLRGYGKVTRDLTERRAHEETLRQREQAVSGVLSAATECSIIGTDLDGLITVFNSGAERLLGYQAQELIGIHTGELFHDRDEVAARGRVLAVASGFEVLVSAARTGGAETRPWTYVRKDTSRLPVELTVTPVYDEDRKLRGFIGIAVDLTERQRVEDELRAALEEAKIMETAFRDAPGGVALLALDGRFLRVNQALCEILGRSAQEIVGSTSAGFTHPDDQGVTGEAFDHLRLGGRSDPRREAVPAPGRTGGVGLGEGHRDQGARRRAHPRGVALLGHHRSADGRGAAARQRGESAQRCGGRAPTAQPREPARMGRLPGDCHLVGRRSARRAHVTGHISRNGQWTS